MNDGNEKCASWDQVKCGSLPESHQPLLQGLGLATNHVLVLRAQSVFWDSECVLNAFSHLNPTMGNFEFIYSDKLTDKSRRSC